LKEKSHSLRVAIAALALLSTEHYATPLARTHAVHEWERQIDIAEKIVT
jgi:hypothetical protein